MEQQTATATTDAATEKFLDQAWYAKLEITEQAIAKCNASFARNWEYAFVWYAEEMLAKQNELKLLSKMVEMSNRYDWLTAFVEVEKELTRFLDNVFNVREASTNAMSNEASTIKYRSSYYFREWLRETMRNERAWNKA